MPEFSTSGSDRYSFIIDDVKSDRDEEKGYSISFRVHGLDSPEDVINFYEESLKGWVDGLEIEGDNEKGYSISADLSGFKMPGQAVNFYNQHLKKKARKRDLPIFGNEDRERAKNQMVEMNTSAVFDRAVTEEGLEEGKWAVDAYSALQRFDFGEGEKYEEAANNLAAVSLASVSLSEGAERKSAGFNFYKTIVDEISSYTEPVKIDVLKEEDTAGDKSVEVDVVEGDEEDVIPLEEAEPEPEEEIPFDEEVLDDVGLEEEALEPEDREAISDSVYQTILSENVDEAKESIAKIDEPDYETLLEKEREGKNRITLKRYLEERIEDEEERES